MKKKLAYFAADGNFGTAVGLEILDTTKWTEEDWRRIDNASDGERAGVAHSIANTAKQQIRFPRGLTNNKSVFLGG